ncbi:unnamed protein product [Urochloa decumbens]|uniref:non-specific serine/threonine protein kinase n=1 Tax=Urochloa decumbens TaxID=240449 RepID=A0ABC8VZ22_9POAL
MAVVNNNFPDDTFEVEEAEEVEDETSSEERDGHEDEHEAGEGIVRDEEEVEVEDDRMWRRCRRLAMKMSCFTPLDKQFAPGEPSSVRHGFSTDKGPHSSSMGATSSVAAARAISTAKGPHIQDFEEDEDQEEELEDSYGKQFEIRPSLLQDAPPAMELEEVSFQFLEEITDGFSEERRLGEGAFGVVYKGVTKNGGGVAVKKLKFPDVDLEYVQFKNEFDHLTKLRHLNIVQILGYCYETQKKTFIMDDQSKVTTEEIYAALCLEYLDNGSLQKHLSDKFCELDWHTRFKIIKGTCEGLKYIHDELEEPIYHLDIKPANILLNEDMVPKIADFGLSRIIGKEQIHKAKHRYGTPGYQPPEHIETCEISGKFDIFSLGIVIIKIVSGPEGYAIYLDGMSNDEFNKDEFINQVRKDWRNRLQATYRDDISIEAYCQQVEACTQIALNCVEKDKQQRPDILKITEMLNEIEIDVGQLRRKRCHITVSAEISHTKNTRKESEDMTGQHKNVNLMTGPSCSELLEFVHAPEKHIVGRTEEKVKIIASLFEGMSRKITILPIYGMGGIGKTTFARLIYDDSKFDYYSKVWVNVSQRFDLNTILKSIISQLSGKESLSNKICLSDLLSGKNILIVLDDVWEDNQFMLKELKDKLYHDKSNITILVTTRSERVAEIMCTNLQPYKILPLTDEMCWDIIKQRSGFEDRDNKEQLMGIGRKIAQKCGGMPLAALSLGFTLRSMNFDLWMKVKDSDIWNESFSKELSVPNPVLPSLKLSYSHISSPCLKQCFIYCSTFPKGHEMFKDDLIYQWISLDFIKPTKLHSNIELGEKYIAQLLGLSFLSCLQHSVSTENSSNYPEQAKLFTMHDLVHDLAISLFGNQILDQGKQGNNSGSSCQYALLTDCSKALEVCLTPRARLIRLSFLDNSRSKLSDVTSTAGFMRVADISESSVQTMPDYCTGKWKQLTYLNASGIPDRMVPESITTLSKLIYLNLQGSAIIALPESIGEMECLMHLDLSACERIQQLPASFRNLEKLVHLNLSNCYHVKGVPDALKGLTNLQYLSLFQCSIEAFNCRLRGLQDVIGNLTKLRHLNLDNSLHGIPVDGMNSILRSICTFSNLQHLVLSENFNIFSIPETVAKLTKLHTLDLRFCSNLRRLPASISEIDSLKFLDVTECEKLDRSKLPRFSKCSVILPHFFVHADDGKPSSNLVQLKDENPPKLEISGLENVKSVEEAQMIKLVEKTTTLELQLEWTKDAKRSVEDIDVLREFVPASTLEVFTLRSYNSVSFPTWVIRIAINLPLIRTLELNDLPWCRTLPPLGQLQNLLSLFIIQMGSIRKIDEDVCGGARAFPKLQWLSIKGMENLEEWNTTYSHSEDGSGVLVFSKKMEMYIVDCPKLKLKPRPPAGFSDWVIQGSDNVLSSWGEDEHCQVTELFVRSSKVPLHQWRVLYHLPALSILRILDCRDLTCSSLDILRGHPTLKILTVEDSESIAGLLDGLETLTSLEKLEIISCTGAKALPEGITQLTNLRYLKIKNCPELVQWCKSEENSTKLAHIKKIKLVNDEECDEELESDEESVEELESDDESVEELESTVESV